MAKGRTKYKGARHPEILHKVPKWPPHAPSAYFTTTDARHGYAEAALGAFYDPLQPVCSYSAFIHPGPAKPLEWSSNAWVTDVQADHLTSIIPAIERAFTPMQYRFEPIQI